MSKNRTMAIKHAKVVQYGIKASKTAMLADVMNMPKAKPFTSGLGLYADYASAARERANKNAKWRAK